MMPEWLILPKTGTESYRDISLGSLYIQELTKVFMDQAAYSRIDDMLMKVFSVLLVHISFVINAITASVIATFYAASCNLIFGY